MARWISAAATEESTPPESPRITSSLPTCSRIRAIASDDVVGHVPVAGAAADVVTKRLRMRRALQRVRDLGMELHARRSRAPRRPWPAIGQASVEAMSLKPGGSSVTLSPWLIHTLSMPWPSGVRKSSMPSNSARVAARAHLGIAEFAHLAGLDLAAQLPRHGLHAVADAQHRHAQIEHRLRRARRRVFGHRHVAAGQDHAAGAEFAHELVADVVGMDFAVDPRFAHAARDQLRVLRAEVEDENFLVHCLAFKNGRAGRARRGTIGPQAARSGAGSIRPGNWAPL